MKGKVSISRRTLMKGDGVVSIKITDDNSRQVVVEVLMSLSEFAEAVTGMSECEADVKHILTPEQAGRIGMKCITEQVTICLTDGEYRLPKDTPKQFFEQYIPSGYVLHYDGLGAKQPNGKHVFSVRKWVDLGGRNDQ